MDVNEDRDHEHATSREKSSLGSANNPEPEAGRETEKREKVRSRGVGKIGE